MALCNQAEQALDRKIILSPFFWYPQDVMWLASGQTAPEIGQTSPHYDEANRKLSQPNAG